MRFNNGTGIDSSRRSRQSSGRHLSVRRRRPALRRIALRVGIGVALVGALAWLVGAGPLGRPGPPTGVRAEPGDVGRLATDCVSVTDFDDNPDCRYPLLVESIQQFWTGEFARRGTPYESAATTLFSDSVRTACGAAAGRVGPFYCPADHEVYLDLGFFDMLRAESADGSAAFGEAYVLAHEYGHHVQNLTGQMWRLRPGTGPASDAVRLELQADCFAGVWAHHVTRPTSAGAAPIAYLSPTDIEDGLGAAENAGDDYIEEHFQSTALPELWAHGSSAQRLRWFEIGFAGGTVEDCDTFSVTTP